MTRPSVEEGFEFWHEEVRGLDRPECDEPYIPAIALTGLYVALHSNADELTSYHWRQAVLRSPSAMEGYRMSLTSFHRDELDLDEESPIDREGPGDEAPAQYKFMHHSLMNGLPETDETIPWNEEFLACTLGRASHDHSVWFDPLKLYDQGPVALRNHYPQTAAYIEKLS